VRAVGSDHVSVADAHEYIGDVLADMKRPAEALVHYEKAAEIRIDRLPDTHRSVGLGQASIGRMLLGVGRPAEASLKLERGLALLEARDPDDEDLHELRFDLARAIVETDHDRALVLAERALAGLDAAPADDEETEELRARMRDFLRVEGRRG
jgi:tetratricopeptide (TPR) repeat protein